MMAGVGLSRDLANPRKTLPLGIMSATVAGMMVYFFVVVIPTKDDIDFERLVEARSTAANLVLMEFAGDLVG